MEASSLHKPSVYAGRRMRISVVAILLIALAAGTWIWHMRSSATNAKGSGAFQVVSAAVTQTDVSVRLTSNGPVADR